MIGNLLPEKRLATATCLQQCILLRVNNTDILEALEDPEAKLAVSKKVRAVIGSLSRPIGDALFSNLSECSSWSGCVST